MNIGSLGASSGRAVTVKCSTSDWLRSSFLWLVLFFLLLRKPNRTANAWLIWIPLLASYLLICGIENNLAGHLVWYLMQYTASSFAELLRLFAISLAILLTVADVLINVKSRILRFLSILLILVVCGTLGIRLNGWPLFDSRLWTIAFLALLLFFFAFHLIFKRVVAFAFRKTRCLFWYPVCCLACGILPCTMIAGAGTAVAEFNPSTFAAIFLMVSGSLFLHYCILGFFAVISLRNSVYRRRFICCFLPEHGIKNDENQL